MPKRRKKGTRHMQKINKMTRAKSEAHLYESPLTPGRMNLIPEKSAKDIALDLRETYLQETLEEDFSDEDKPVQSGGVDEYDDYDDEKDGDSDLFENQELSDIFDGKKKAPNEAPLLSLQQSSATFNGSDRLNFGRKNLYVDSCIASPRMTTSMEKTIQVRDRDSRRATSGLRWGRLSIANSIANFSDGRRTPQNLEIPQSRAQYRIRSKEKVKRMRFWNRIKDCFLCRSSRRLEAFTYDSLVGVNPWSITSRLDPNRAFVGYLSWSFRTSFTLLFLSLSLAFFVLIFIFSFIMMILGKHHPTCFQPNFNEAQTPFADAYALSWTTFTTVGYGHTYPSKGVEEPNQSVCFWLHILCTFESFVGVLFAGICGAIIFGKVTRIQSLAPIVFSDPITVRYGKGLIKETEADIPEGKIPCPILTFRLANLHSDRVGGEVVDSLINVMGIFNSTIEELNEENGFTSPRADASNQSGFGDIEHGIGGGRRMKRRSMLKSSPSRVVVNEDPGSSVNILRSFDKLSIDTSENPYFKRTWTVNHVLDSSSPLLLPHIRRAIIDNDNYWPSYLNDAESVRECIRFSQIFVSVSGISVVCADSVYAQHLYNFMDMNVGYQFVPILYTSDTLDIKVDFETLNDVVEQEGGGGEIFYDDDSQNDSKPEEYHLSMINDQQMIKPLPKDKK